MNIYQYYSHNPLRALVCAASFVAAFFLIVALIAQYGLHMHPCELCIAQRIPYGIIAMVGLFAGMTLHSPRALKTAGLICAFLFVADAAIAIYHTGVEMGYFPGPSACTNNDKPGQSLEEMRAAIMNAQLVPCDQPMGYILGLSMASWNALAATVSAVAMFIALSRSQTPTEHRAR